MRETGILSIVRHRHTLQVRYASCNPYDIDRMPYQCPDESTLVVLLDHWGIDTWTLQQAIAALRKGEVAVLRVVLSETQLQTYFPQQRVPRVCQDVQDGGRRMHPLQGENVCPLSGPNATPSAPSVCTVPLLMH
jgi:hypothetical protein